MAGSYKLTQDRQGPTETQADLRLKPPRYPKKDPSDPNVKNKKVTDSVKKPADPTLPTGGKLIPTKTLLNIKTGGSNIKTGDTNHKTEKTKDTVSSENKTSDARFKSPNPVVKMTDKTKEKNKMDLPSSDSGLASGTIVVTPDLSKVPDSTTGIDKVDALPGATVSVVNPAETVPPIISDPKKVPDLMDSPVPQNKHTINNPVTLKTRKSPVIKSIDDDTSTSEVELENRDSRLSTTTDDDSNKTKERTGRNIKFTKKQNRSTHPWSLARSPSKESGTWTCQLCSAGSFTTASGTRRHYRNHYKKWDSINDTYFDMTEGERDRVMLTKSLKKRIPIVSNRDFHWRSTGTS